jgi:branched-chain amino acid aminotransferase
MYISLNGNFYLQSENIFGATNRAFNYGDGFFDSLLCLNGKPKLFKDHVVRMQHAAKVLKLSSEFLTPAKLFDTTTSLLKKNNLPNARIRITFFREEGGQYAPEKNNSSMLITLRDIEGLPFNGNVAAKKMHIVKSIHKNYSAISSFKNCNSLVYVLAGLEIKENNWEDGILLNDKENICEALFSNLFFVKNSVVYTPAITEGCINGVMRRFIINTLSKKLKVEEGSFSVVDLLKADGVFITNASQGLVPVASINQTFFETAICLELNTFLKEQYNLQPEF